MHLSEDHDETGAEEDEQDGEAPVDEPVGLERVGVPRAMMASTNEEETNIMR
jgi:hypothetical protein